MTDTQDFSHLRALAAEWMDRELDVDDFRCEGGSTSINKLMRAYVSAANPSTVLTILYKLDAAQAEIERLKAVTFEPGELAAHGIKTPTPMEFGAAITKRLNEKWWVVVEKAHIERDQALARLADAQAEIERLRNEKSGPYFGHYQDALGKIARLEDHIKHIGNDALRTENAKLITALAECRDAFLAPGAGSDLYGWYVSAIADPLEVPEYVKACLAVQPSQPVDGCGWCRKGVCNKHGVGQEPSQAGELSDEEIRKWWGSENGLEDMGMRKIDDFTKVVRAVIAAINAKESK